MENKEYKIQQNVREAMKQCFIIVSIFCLFSIPAFSANLSGFSTLNLKCSPVIFPGLVPFNPSVFNVNGFNTNFSASLKTEWSEGYGRSVKKQNDFNLALYFFGRKYKVPQLWLKSIMIQESNGNPDARNACGYAGLMQTGANETRAAGFSIGITKKSTLKNGKKQWIYSPSDERFNPVKSIEMGAFTLMEKVRRIEYWISKSGIGMPASFDESIKFYTAAYNAGEGTLWKAVKLAYSGKENCLRWDDLLKSSSGKIQDSPLYRAMPSQWNRDMKYKEITEYVRDVLKRVNQSEKPFCVF